MSFVLEGFDTLSQNLSAGGSTTAAKQLDKDLQKYENRATDYCKKIMKEAAVGLPAGSRPVLAPPDPLTFWNIQVCHLQSYLCRISWLILQADSRDFSTTLPEICQDLLCVPCTSVPAERLFSLSGLLTENRRNRISPVNLQNRVIIKGNKFF